MSVNGLPDTQVQNQVIVTKTMPLVQQQNKQPSQYHLQQQQQKTANGRLPDGANRMEMHGVPLKPQQGPVVLVPQLQHFNTVQRHFARLRCLFPGVNPAILRKVLESCQGDFIRAVDNILYIQRSQQKRIIPTPQPMPLQMLPTQIVGVSSGQSVASGCYGSTWQDAVNVRALPNIQLSTKLNPRIPLQNINTVQQPQQVLRVPILVPSFEHWKATSYHPQFLPYVPVVPHLKPEVHFISSQQGPNHQQPSGTYQNLEGSKVLLNLTECNKTPGNSVASLPAPTLIGHRSSQEDKENEPIKFMNKGEVITPNQCMENLKLVQTDEISETHKSVLSSAPQKRPHFMIQDEVNNALKDEKKKMKVLENLPKGSVESKLLTLSDSSQAECSQVIAGIGPSPGLLQSAMTCHPEHTVGIPDRNTSQPCNMLKIQLRSPRNVNTEVKDEASAFSVADQSCKTDRVPSTETGVDMAQRYI